MQSFKQYLKEESANSNFIIFNDEEVKKDNKEYYGGEYENSEFLILDENKIPSPVNKYTTLNGDLFFDNCYDLISFIGCPKIINGTFSIEDLSSNHNSTKLTSLEHAPIKVAKDVIFNGCIGLTSLEGIGVDFFVEIGNNLWIPRTITSNVLGMIKIKNLKNVFAGSSSGELKLAIIIINQHLRSGRRISKCRQELIEAGLKEFAKL
jgi:hypothetical protein